MNSADPLTFHHKMRTRLRWRCPPFLSISRKQQRCSIGLRPRCVGSVSPRSSSAVTRRNGAPLAFLCPLYLDGRHQGGRSNAVLPAALLAGLQPNRERLLEAQGHPAPSRRTHHRSPMGRHPRGPDAAYTQRMRQLLHRSRLRARLIGFCPSYWAFRHQMRSRIVVTATFRVDP
jgi:hypothetical protein